MTFDIVHFMEVNAQKKNYSKPVARIAQQRLRKQGLLREGLAAETGVTTGRPCCGNRGYFGKALLRANVLQERHCIESTAYADMQPSLHLRKRGYILLYRFSFLRDRSHNLLVRSASYSPTGES